MPPESKCAVERRPVLRPVYAVMLATGGLVSVPTGAQAQAPEADAASTMPTIVVVGEARDDIARQPGAVSIVSAEDLRIQQPRSTEEALRAVPGVAIKPEEESAIVANIGIRGLSSADYKTLILEDGAPVAPGLFVGNARYYNPRIQRMGGIEVLKGAASLRYGPSTIGGVINYVTREPVDGFEIGLRAGSFDTTEATLELGTSTPSGDARFGAFLTYGESDGFMDKGYEMTDVMLKAGMDIGGNQRLGIKYAGYDNDANISYRGLFLDAYRQGARYNPAPDDWFLTGRRSLDLNHEWVLGCAVRSEPISPLRSVGRHGRSSRRGLRAGAKRSARRRRKSSRHVEHGGDAGCRDHL